MKDMSLALFVVEQEKDNMIRAELCLNCLQQQLMNVLMIIMLHAGRPGVCKYHLIQILYSFVNVCIFTHLKLIFACSSVHVHQISVSFLRSPIFAIVICK